MQEKRGGGRRSNIGGREGYACAATQRRLLPERPSVAASFDLALKKEKRHVQQTEAV